MASLEDVVSLAKRRGFIYPGSEIYGGLAGTYDYGPLGAKLKRNIENAWLKMFVDNGDNMYLIDSAILMNPKVWQASGHVDTFTDPLIEDVKTHKRYRLDHLLEDAKIVDDASNLTIEELIALIKKENVRSTDGNELANPAKFNLMYKTNTGPVEDESSVVYLRPETAQGMFVNFKNIIDSFYPDLPFGIAQIGRAFRNEISPRDFLFRLRELQIMEFEYFIAPEQWEEQYEKLRKDMHQWFIKGLGLPADKIKEVEVPEADRAHYSKRSIDFHFDFPSMGFAEVGGLAYRTDYDLKNHQEKSGKNLEYTPKGGGKPFIPHVIEPTFGLDRNFLAVLANSYTEDEIAGEKRLYLKLPNELAPVKVAVFPLLKNKPDLIEKANEVYDLLSGQLGSGVMFDDNGNIGKRYRRQDEIGTPWCVTIDFESLDNDDVTLRSRDTTEQVRVKIDKLLKQIAN